MRMLNLGRNASKFLGELPQKQYKQVASRTLDLLRDPAPHDRRPVKGTPGCWRIDVGEYRVAYRFDDQTVSIAMIDVRNDDRIYDRLERTTRGSGV
jgi:mRNA interferase RelE/StbE